MQLSGIAAVTFYAADIFNRAGLVAICIEIDEFCIENDEFCIKYGEFYANIKGDNADSLATIQTVIGLAVTALSCVLVDHVGRRPLLLTSQAMMLPFLTGLVCFYIYNDDLMLRMTILFEQISMFY